MVDSYLMLSSKYSVTFYFIKGCWELEWLMILEQTPVNEITIEPFTINSE